MTGEEEQIPVIEHEVATSVSMLRWQGIFDPMVHSKLFERSNGQKNEMTWMLSWKGCMCREVHLSWSGLAVCQRR
jgi:hypothetical protein